MVTRQGRLGRNLLGLAMTLGLAAGVCVAAEPAAVIGQLGAEVLPGLRADVATLIMQGASGGAIELAVAVDLGRNPRIEGKNKLSLVVEVSGDSMLAAVESVATKTVLAVEFYAYVVDTDGLVAAHLARRVAIPVDDWGERLSSGGLRFVEELEVPNGELSIRSLILIPDAGRFGMALSEVGHDDAEAPGALGRPRFKDRCDDWLPVVTPGSTADVRSSARPLWRAGDQVTAVVARAGDEPKGGTRVIGLLTSSSGDITRVAASIERVGRSREITELVLGFLVPEVEVGVYSFAVASGEDAAVESVATEVWIVPRPGEDAAADRSACAWPQIMKEARQLLADGAPIISGEGRGGSLSPTASKAYVDLLRRFGAGEDLATTLDALVVWEQSVLGEEDQRSLEVLMFTQLEVAQALAEVDPESLLPVFRLHQVAYRERFERGDFTLARHSRRLAAGVAEIWIHRPGRGEEAGWVTDALVSLAEIADRNLMFKESQGFLERAVEVDPKNRVPRLLLAMLYEKLGRYEAASDHLEQLLESAPADAEGRLRLATLQRRLGRPVACRDSLHRVIGQRPEPWILSLAYQTLVKELYAEEKFVEGLRVLAEAELVLPGDRALGLAKAYGLDRLNRGRKAVEVLERLPLGSDEGMSYRLVYTQSARELARRVNARLRRSLLIRQARLRQAVVQVFGEAR